MKPFDVLDLGQKYSKRDLADLLDQPNVVHVREGVYTCKNSPSYLLFVDLEKKGKEERFHFDDFFEEDFFHWDSQTTQHIDSPKIQDIVNGDLTPHLFVRITPNLKVLPTLLSIAEDWSIPHTRKTLRNRCISCFKVPIMTTSRKMRIWLKFICGDRQKLAKRQNLK